MEQFLTGNPPSSGDDNVIEVPSTTAIMDRNAALKRAGGDLELLRELAELFLADTPPLVAEMERAIATANWHAVHRGAHRLKGAVSNFDAKILSELLAALESRARAEDAREAERLFAQVKSELARFETELDGFFEEAA